MNTAEILKAIEHRELPPPKSPWVMTQSWQELLFAHWPLPPNKLRALIPQSLQIDTFEGEAWVGIVPFRMSNVHPRGLPSVRGLSQFPELNVRTYVRARAIPGVYFFSLDAGNPLAVAIARAIYHLPYYNAVMSCQREGESIRYHSLRTHRGAPAAGFDAVYRPIGQVTEATRGSLQHWLTERYSLYTSFQDRLYRGEVHHRLWPLQDAEWELEYETMARSHNITLPDTSPLLHYSQRQDVLIWPLNRVG